MSYCNVHAHRASTTHQPLHLHMDTGLGGKLNAATLEALFACFGKVRTDNNLLVISRAVLPLVNHLTAFSKLRDKGRVTQTIWLDSLPSPSELAQAAAAHSSLVVLVSLQDSDLHNLKALWQALQHTLSLPWHIVAKDCTRATYYSICQALGRPVLLESCTKIELASTVRISERCRLLPWKTHPVFLEECVLSLDEPTGGLRDYLRNPLPLVSRLGDAVAQLVASTFTQPDSIKFRNVFAKGDHASLLATLVMRDRIPELLASSFSPAEQEFYDTKLSGNADLVVLERNLDYFPLLLGNLQYLGLLDDLFGLDEVTGLLVSRKESLVDELYVSIKHLNFAALGPKLNTLAKFIQSEYSVSELAKDMAELRRLVSSLGSLATKQELVRKHTVLCEAILDILKSDINGPYTHNFREKWVQIQNDFFDLEYKDQLAAFFAFLDEMISPEVALSFICLISLANDGVRPKDLESLEQAISISFGKTWAIALFNLKRYKIVKVNTKSNDFFSNFSFGRMEIETTTTTTTTAGVAQENDEKYSDVLNVGVTGGQDVYKSTYTLINKFWNLHPDDDERAIESVADYTLPGFALSAGTVPLTTRFVESLYFRDFLRYKPVNSVSRRPNWTGLNLDTMFKGQTVDRNLCDELDKRKPVSAVRQEYLFVVYIGGVTRSELSVLQHLQARLKKQIYVVTTGFVNNKKLMLVMTSV